MFSLVPWEMFFLLDPPRNLNYSRPLSCHPLSIFLIISELSIENPQENASLEMELSDLNRTWGSDAKTDLEMRCEARPVWISVSSLAWDQIFSKASHLL